MIKGKKGSRKNSVLVPMILILLQYIFYYIKTIRRKKMEKTFQEKMIKNDKWGEGFVEDNADLEVILFYMYHKDSEESGVMLI